MAAVKLAKKADLTAAEARIRDAGSAAQRATLFAGDGRVGAQMVLFGTPLRPTDISLRLYQSKDGSNHWTSRLEVPISTTPGGNNPVHQWLDNTLDAAMESVEADDPSIEVKLTNGTPSTLTQVAEALAYNGEYHQTASIRVLHWTAPIGATKIGYGLTLGILGGPARVFIDDDPERATLLPTAQEYVDRGILASTALVANGGNLTPDTRLIDHYSLAHVDRAAWFHNQHIGLADDLDPTVAHVVRVEKLAYATIPPGVNGKELYFERFTHNANGLTGEDSGAEVLPMVKVMTLIRSAQEYAFECEVSGQARLFIGNIHGYEIEDDFLVYVDGAPFDTSAAGDAVWGTQVTVVRNTRLRHPDVDAGATDVANVQTVYRLTREGLLVTHRDEWIETLDHARYYSVMMAVNGWDIDRAQLFNEGLDRILDDHDDTSHGMVPAPGATVWDPSGGAASMVYIPDPATTFGDWVFSAPDYAMFTDRPLSGVSNHQKIIKLYMARSTAENMETLAASEADPVVRISQAMYSAVRVPGGAANALLGQPIVENP